MASVRRRPWMVWAGGITLITLGPGLLDWAWISWHQHVAARRLSALNARHQALADTRQRLTSDPLAVEDLARSTLKVAKPGEIVVPLHSSRRSNRSSP